MLDSRLAWTITQDIALRERIQALIWKLAIENGVTTAESEMLRTPPIEHLLRAVAGNAQMFGAIKTALEGQDNDTSVPAAIETGLTDGDLTWLLTQEITCLQGG